MPLTTLKYAGRCASCRAPLSPGHGAYFDPATRTVTCLNCHAVAAGPTPAQASVRRFADSQHARRQARLRRWCGPLAPLVGWLVGDDRATAVAKKGAAGEERLAAYLNKVAARSGGTVAVLHDRAVPGRRENLDHVVVTPTGVWAVDAKAYGGAIRVSGWARRRLTMGGRDGTDLVAQSRRQQRFLSEAFGKVGLPALPVHGALCFVDAQMGWLSNGTDVDGVVVCTPRRLRALLTATGPLTREQVAWTAAKLHNWFTPS